MNISPFLAPEHLAALSKQPGTESDPWPDVFLIPSLQLGLQPCRSGKVQEHTRSRPVLQITQDYFLKMIRNFFRNTVLNFMVICSAN